MSRFKVGDRVRMKRTVCIDYATFPRGTEGYVVRIDSIGLWVEMPNSENGKLTSWWCLDSNIELVAPADKKREFLERLQSLMREFDAKIDFGGNDKGLGFIFSIGKDKVFIPYVVGTGEIDPNGFPKTKVEATTADNIMDFDKE